MYSVKSPMISPETSPMTVQTQAVQGALTAYPESPTSLSGRVISAAIHKVGIRAKVEMTNYYLRTLETSSKVSHLAVVVASKVVKKQATMERALTMMG